MGANREREREEKGRNQRLLKLLDLLYKQLRVIYSGQAKGQGDERLGGAAEGTRGQHQVVRGHGPCHALLLLRRALRQSASQGQVWRLTGRWPLTVTGD